MRLHLGDAPNALLVPELAVNSNRLGTYVYVVDRGVRAGEYVLVGDLPRVSPGMQVRPLPQAPSTSATSAATAIASAAPPLSFNEMHQLLT